ncbi:hypothetical protein GCM10007304_34260 [Rhodococcoides trifolii]|uniref:Uncharacterized protein n=1 Tax=Rhodococcoides trifolii TaxID=908250 RepID=A0A917G1F8_9NOCA|nr:hypothetical protein GCM10007304_34260 [Rhodococcus trifolii]
MDEEFIHRRRDQLAAADFDVLDELDLESDDDVEDEDESDFFSDFVDPLSDLESDFDSDFAGEEDSLAVDPARESVR